MGASSGFNMGGLFIPLIFMFGVMYLLVIRPQKKRDQKRREMIAAVQKNDRILTAGGIHGVVVAVKERDVVVRVDDDKNVRMTFSKNAIARVITDDDDDEGDETR